MQVLGLCRFSYPCQGGFQIDHDTIADRIAFLFAPERLEERFALFETLHLPAIRAQTDPDFTYLVVTGEQLPPPYMDRLKALLVDIPQAILLPMPPMNHRDAMGLAIKAHIDHADGCTAQFRLDDDDAVAVDFVEKIRASWDDTKSFFYRDKFVAVDFNRGILMGVGNDQLTTHTVFQHVWAPGLAVLLRPRAANTVMHFAHHKLAHFMSVVNYPQSDMYIRSYNKFNDSHFPKILTDALTPPDDDMRKHLCERFRVDVDEVRTAYRAAIFRSRAKA